MTNATPVVYLLHGDDEYTIAQFVADLESKLGDPATAAMNTTRLDGNTFNPDQLMGVAGAMPFIAKRRLVILTRPTAKLSNSQPAREKFKATLDSIPPTTALVLVENKVLTEPRDRRAGKLHWLERWAESAKGYAFNKEFSLPKGPALVRWVVDKAKASGGQFTHEAAEVLVALVGDDPRQADQEVQKLLAFVNYRRPVEPEDVEMLTAETAEADIFTMVDALGERNGKKAMALLQRLKEQQDPIPIFGMIVRQFRLLLLAREVLDRGGNLGDVARELKVHPFVAEKVSGQARHFSLATLENVYRRLLEMDAAMKGEMEPSLVLDTLVARFTR